MLSFLKFGYNTKSGVFYCNEAQTVPNPLNIHNFQVNNV